MAQLPDFTSLGESPSARPQTGVVSYDPTSGMEQAVGSELAQSGRNLEVAANIETAIVTRMMEAAQRVQSRADTIERVRAISAYTEAGAEALRRASTEQDFSRPETMTSYGELLNKTRDDLIKNHRGSADSRAMLFQRLEGVRTNMISQAAAVTNAAQIAMVDKDLGGKINNLAYKAYQNPASLFALFTELDSEIADRAGALTPEKETQHRTAGRSQITRMALDNLVSNLQFEKALNILSMPGVSDILGEDAQRSVLTKISSYQNAIRDEMAKAAGVANARIGIAQSLLGRPLNEPEILKSLDMLPPTPSGLFGNELQGRALSLMTSLAPGYANSVLSLNDEIAFRSAITAYTQSYTTQAPDPITGLLVPTVRRNVLPPDVIDAVKRRDGMDIRALDSDQLAAAWQIYGATKRGERMTIDRIGERSTEEAPQVTTQLQSQPQPSSTVQRQKTVAEMVTDVAGVVPGTVEALSHTPIVGSVMNARDTNRAQQYVSGLQATLISTLQNNTRYPEGERLAIKEIVNIGPQFWTTPTARLNELEGLDDQLEVRYQTALKTAGSKTTGREVRTDAANIAQAISEFRKSLLYRIYDISQIDTVPEGALFLSPDGWKRNVKRK